MIFEVKAESENGTIRDVILFVRQPNGSGARFQASYDEENQVWRAHPWSAGEGRPAWTPFEFFWRIRDETEATVETPHIPIDYWDPTREWYRVEGRYAIIYWFGFEGVSPEYVAENAMLAVDATEPRRIEGFGGPLSYKPVGVIYPTDEALAEIYGSGQTNTNAAGFTSSDLGMTVQEISMPSDDWFKRLGACIYLTPREDRTEQWRVDGAIFGTIPHEIAHLYQFDKRVGGPNWWTEGQADYFTYSAGQYDARLRHLATLQDVASLQGNIPAFTIESDGCYALAYDMGVSFINWLLSNYGGLETHAQIVDLLGRNIILEDAIEQVVGKEFEELENEWRVYLGYRPFTPQDRDPTLALQDLVDPLYLVGDVVTIPGPRPMGLYPAPGPGQIPSSASCFPNLTATITNAGNIQGINYYEVDCSGLKGWGPRKRLTHALESVLTGVSVKAMRC
jgi:hypothetical protein